MIKEIITNNVVSSVIFDGNDLIKPWGVETADTSSFFSLEAGIGYRYNFEDFHQSYKDNKLITEAIVSMKHGLWKLYLEECFYDFKISRRCTLEALEDTLLMDFVLRQRFNLQHFHTTMINNTTLSHHGSNIYHQHATNRVNLFGPNYNVSVTINHVHAGSKLSPLMYVRDHDDEWVVHARMLPKTTDVQVIKICKAWCKTRPLPIWLGNIILKNKEIKNFLWYVGERENKMNKYLKRFLFPNAFPLVYLEKGEKLIWDLDVTFLKS